MFRATKGFVTVGVRKSGFGWLWSEDWTCEDVDVTYHDMIDETHPICANATQGCTIEVWMTTAKASGCSTEGESGNSVQIIYGLSDKGSHEMFAYNQENPDAMLGPRWVRTAAELRLNEENKSYSDDQILFIAQVRSR